MTGYFDQFINLLHESQKLWGQIPGEFWGIFWGLLLITVSSYPLVLFSPLLRDKIRSRLDRWNLALFVGLGYYTLLFILLNALFRVPIGENGFYVVFVVTSLAGYGWLFLKKVDRKETWDHKHWLVLGSLVFLIFISANARYAGTLYAPERLMDSDPYRHYPRTEWIIQTGDVAKWDPWLVGEVPVFEAQGCYVLAALLATVGHVDSWNLWKFGSVFMGILSLISFYLFGAYFMPGKPRRFSGVLAAYFLAGSAVHIIRTNIGFSVAWALPFLPLALLMVLWCFRYRSFEAGVLFGVFFLWVGLSNMVPVSVSVAFIFFYCVYHFAKALWFLRTDRSRWKTVLLYPFSGLAAGTVLFLAFLFIWQSTYASVSLSATSKASAFENRTIMKGVYKNDELKEKQNAANNSNLGSVEYFLGNHIGWHNTSILNRYIFHEKLIWGVPAIFLVVLILAMQLSHRNRTLSAISRDISQTAWFDTKVFLLFFLCVPLAQFCLLHYFMRPNTLENGEIISMPWLITRLKSDDKWIQHLFVKGFSQETRNNLIAYRVSEPIPEKLATAVQEGLSDIIEAHLLFNEHHKIRGDLRVFREKTRRLMLQVQKGDDLSYINRLIVEDFFPHAIKRRDLFGLVRVPTFTGRTYRYLVLPSMCLALGLALGIGLLLEALKLLLSSLRIYGYSSISLKWGYRAGVLAIGFLVTFHVLKSNKSGGYWAPTSKANEEAAYRWMAANLTKESTIFAYWFEADFLRSYMARAGKPVFAVFTGNRKRSGVRSIFWPPVEIDGLKIPDMRSIDDMLNYAKQHPRKHYVLQGRHSPGLPLDHNNNFRLIAKFSDQKWGDVKLYQLLSSS